VRSRGWVVGLVLVLSLVFAGVARADEHIVVGGHVVLMNRGTYMVMDIIHFEM